MTTEDQLEKELRSYLTKAPVFVMTGQRPSATVSMCVMTFRSL